MYYVPDGTKKCGLYECRLCRNRFLSLHLEKLILCPDCEGEVDAEIGPDEEMAVCEDTAELVEVIEGEDVEMMDKLMSLAVTGGDYEWL